MITEKMEGTSMQTTMLSTAFPGMSILEQTPLLLRNLLKDADRDILDWQPSRDRWSISMVLAHLADVEIRGFSNRFTSMAGQDNPYLPSYDQLDLFRNGKQFDGPGELDTFESRRGELLSWFRTLPASVESRTGRHEQLGTITFGELLHEVAFHDMGHIRQILELYRSRAFYPNMGAFRSYYQIHP
jgi:hypothetical protein